MDKGVIEVVGFRKTMKNYARTFFPVDSKQKYIVNQITDGMSEEERKKLYEYLIGEEKKLEMIKYIQNLLTKRSEPVCGRTILLYIYKGEDVKK